MGPNDPSKYLRSATITSSHNPSALRSRTKASLTTVNSPDRFDLTYRFWYVGSMLAETPTMLEMVAVGAMATQLELRIPSLPIFSLSAAQSRRDARSTSR